MSGADVSEMVSLEAMRWWHLEAVRSIERECFPADAWSAEQFWSELAQPTRRYLVAICAGEVVGYAGLFILAPDADVQTVAVRGDQRGRGIARALLSALLGQADADGVTHTLLEVRADNSPAIAVYDELGFTRISERHRYYADGTDAWVMRRTRSR